MSMRRVLKLWVKKGRKDRDLFKKNLGMPTGQQTQAKLIMQRERIDAAKRRSKIRKRPAGDHLENIKIQDHYKERSKKRFKKRFPFINEEKVVPYDVKR